MRIARDTPALDWAAAHQPAHLVVRRAGAYVVLPGATPLTDAPPIYLRDDEKTLKVGLVEALELPVFDAGAPVPAGLRPMLQRLVGARLMPISQVPVSLLADGVTFQESAEATYLVQVCPWLPILLVFALESLTGTAAQRLLHDRGTYSRRLAGVRLQLAAQLSFAIGG